MKRHSAMNKDTCPNVVNRLYQAAARVPERAALIMPDDESATFAELRDRVGRVAARLQAAGIRPGDRLVVMIPMSIDLYTVLLGIIHAGAVAVFVDPWMSMRKIARFAAFAEPVGFAGVPRSHLLRLFEPALRRLPVTLSTGSGWLARHRLTDWLRTPPATAPWAPDQPDAPALITFTSGSSGTPKGANRTHRFLNAQYQALCRAYTFSETDVDMPMFPVFALRNLADGITSVVPDMDFRRVASVDGSRVQRQIAQHRVTTLTASPPFIDRLANAGPHPSALRRILTGGAPVTDQQLRRWQKAFPETAIQIVYGSTEAEPVASIAAAERLALQGTGVCAGRPEPGVEARVIRITDGPVAFTSWPDRTPGPDGIGELVVAGEHVCRDYFRNPAAVAENKLIDDTGTVWHRMGDTGYFDADARFWLTGRVHSTIRRGDALFHAQLLESQAAGVWPHAHRIAALEWRNELVLVVQGTAASYPEDALRAQGVPVDRVIVTRKQLPLDPRHQSKIDYAALRRLLEKKRL
jgi:olefin beta-lactone synthetase